VWEPNEEIYTGLFNILSSSQCEETKWVFRVLHGSIDRRSTLVVVVVASSHAHQMIN
jgi:hypothetical protein